MTLFRRCSSPLAFLLVIAACAHPGPPPASPAPMAAAPVPIYTPTAIQPRLLPGNPTTALTPEQQAAFTLQQGMQQGMRQGMRQDQRGDQLNAIDPNRPQEFGNPSAQGGNKPLSPRHG